jgi:formylglycine-generating enzyme required for sulfatase activity
MRGNRDHLPPSVGVEKIWQEAYAPHMQLVPAGPFIMGTPEGLISTARSDEFPMHIVELCAFCIAVTPITNLQYAAFVADTGARPPDHWRANLPPSSQYDSPVVNVSWLDAKVFCSWLTELLDQPYRLPTEAEWEKAARGTHGLIYPWGNLWENGHANTLESEHNTIVSVHLFSASSSPYGLLQMAGNVYEWTASLWSSGPEHPPYMYPYSPHDGRENWDASPEVFRIIRGGSFNFSSDAARCAARSRHRPDRSRFDTGFRVVCAGV